MGRLLTSTHRYESTRKISCALAVVVFFAFLSPTSQSQAVESATLQGTIRDPQGRPAVEAIVHLQAKGTTQTVTTKTDSQGGFRFAALSTGVYALRIEMVGYGDAIISALFLGPKEAKTVDLSLGPAKTAAHQPASARAPEFFDPPQFTVAGVTDTTSLGGHGSDTTVRTRETLAKDTVSLGHSPLGSQPPASAATEKLLRDAVEREPQSFEANRRLGKLLLESGRAREAMPYLDRAAEIDSADYENAYDVALANTDAGNYVRAREDAQILIAHRDTAELHHLLGNIHEKLNDPLAAVREYQLAAELDPGEAYLFDWGADLLLHHAPEPAIEVFTKGNHLFPRSVRMLIGLGAAWFGRGSYDQAIRRICDASDLDPDNSAPYLFLGRMLRAESTPAKEAVGTLHRFVTLQPQNAEANYYYAVSLWKGRKSPQDAASAAQIESLLNSAIRLDPKFGAAYLQLGMLHSEQRDFPKAISDYEQAIHVAPQMEEAHYRLAQAYRQTGETDKEKLELQLYDQTSKESAEGAERERREIRQLVYTLRGRSPSQIR